ncbi:methionyl-tRNA formyltransferase [candidate division KSB1 bacterium]|nr:methionyl-tRNA formyltransferase [candidate division KSB1 bacterium]
MKIVFMGTPDFAIPSLAAIYDRYGVKAAVTVPDKPSGRGQKIVQSPVKKYALEKGISVLQPENLRSPAFLDALRDLNADLFIVVAFRILPPEVFQIPPKGTVNLHASLLPLYRGAAPINWAIINGEKETGVTTFFIEEKVDTGHIIKQLRVLVPGTMNAGELHDVLSQAGAELVLQTIDCIADGTCKPEIQTGEATKAPKIFKEMCRIEWRNNARIVYNFIRGLAPYPGAFTILHGQQFKVLSTRIVARNGEGTPGRVIEVGKNGPVVVQTGDGTVELLQVQPPGKRPMTAAEFVRGYSLKAGDFFE